MVDTDDLLPTPTPGQYKARDNSRKERLKSALSTIGILLTAPLIAVLLTFYVFQSYQVDGQSMETTLSDNDRLIVWKLPKTWSRITGHDYVPKRGDVIVFTEPTLYRYGQDPNKQLIKRVIALPGEKIAVHDGKVTVFNSEHPDGFEPDKTLPYGTVIQTTPFEDTWTVGPHQIFVMGDNRNNSLDSRTFGPIDTQRIIGKLAIRVLPLGEMKRF